MKPIVIIGAGEMGGVFARGFLKAGYPVYPVTRNMAVHQVADTVADPAAVLVAVGEKDLQNVVAGVPEAWKDKLILLQNELLPKDWEGKLNNPTVISVWFEKKPGQDYKVIIPSPVFGPYAQLVKDSLEAINIPVNALASADDLLFELVLKNVYILTTNISGLEVGGNVGELWESNQSIAREVAGNVMDIQFKLAAKEFDREAMIESMVKAFEGDLEHKCMGRSAPARLQRALAQADELGLDVIKLRDIAAAKL